MRTMRRQSPTSKRSNCATCCAATRTRWALFWTSTPEPAVPRRSTGRRCCCACTPAGARPTATRSRRSTTRRATRWASSPARSKSRATTPTAISKAKTACTAWCVCRLSTPTTSARRPSRRSSCRPLWTIRSRWSSTPRTSSGTRSARRAPAVRTSTRSRRP